MSNTKVKSYRLSEKELRILDKYDIEWNEFCKKNIEKLDKVDDTLLDRIALRILLIAIGATIYCLSPLLNDIVLIYIEYIISSILILIGSVSLFVMWRKTNARK